MNVRRIRELTFREDSYDLVSEDNSSASVSSSTGLVNIEPGDDSLPAWALSPQHITGSESVPARDDIGRSIFLSFQTDSGEQHRLYLGTTSNVGSAESWVSRVNSIYSRSG